MTAPLTPDDLAAPRRRHQPETPPQHAERLRVLAERSARHAKQNAAWLAEERYRPRMLQDDRKRWTGESAIHPLDMLARVLGLKHNKLRTRRTLVMAETAWQKHLREGQEREVVARADAARNDGRTARRLRAAAKTKE
jgi:hypothetical protein